MSRNTVSINTHQCHLFTEKNHHALTSVYPTTTTGPLKCHIAYAPSLSSPAKSGGALTLTFRGEVLDAKMIF